MAACLFAMIFERCFNYMENTSYIFINTKSNIYNEAVELRHRLFFLPHGLPRETVFDELEDSSIHLAAMVSEKLAGYSRITIGENMALISQIVVEPKLERRGIGRGMLEKLIEKARQGNVKKITLSSRLHAVEFYKKFGFITAGEVYPSAKTGIPHIKMVKYLI